MEVKETSENLAKLAMAFFGKDATQEEVEELGQFLVTQAVTWCNEKYKLGIATKVEKPYFPPGLNWRE